MKLLASLLTGCLADYACCPYDDHGVVFAGCPLSEKTPWAMMNDNAMADPDGVEDHMCKAWEANVDATMEGNAEFDNWGGCGFQRHFPWNIKDAKHGATTDTAVPHCALGVFDCSGANFVNKYKLMDINAGDPTPNTGQFFDLEKGPFGDSDAAHVFGNVHLGAVCKLWIPVRHEHIDSVKVAGVHVNGFGGADSDASVFDASINTDGTRTDNTRRVGTAYCFSVVNIGEFFENNMPGSAFSVMNGNVAGMDAGGHDPILLQGTEYWKQFDRGFGSPIEPSDGGEAGFGTIVDLGGNFDVVVHFKSDWCMRHWTFVDAQIAGDHGSHVVDYDTATVSPNVPLHAHTDIADKSFSGSGVCGCCDAGGAQLDHPSGTTILQSSNGACSTCTACTDMNTYWANVGAGYKWPNAGSWAAFYSFVTCANEKMMIYHDLSTTAPEAGTAGIAPTGFHARKMVHSMFYNDIRHDFQHAHHNTGAIHVRGNFRQVGSDITYCGPGVIDTTVAGGPNIGPFTGNRCTWNWNFETAAANDPERWFERVDPLNFDPWRAAPASTSEIARGDDNSLFTGQTGFVTDIFEQHTFGFIFARENSANSPPTAAAPTGAVGAAALTVDASKYFVVSQTSRYAYSVVMSCLKSSLQGNGAVMTGAAADGTDRAQMEGADATNEKNYRDLFPDCYMGDEIHFNFAITHSDMHALRLANENRITAWFSSVEKV